jgi:hypothetical protein
MEMNSCHALGTGVILPFSVVTVVTLTVGRY